MARKREVVPVPAVAQDRERRTCLVLNLEAEPLAFIPLDVEGGLVVQRLPTPLFTKRWQLLTDYPAEKAARLYAGYARMIGATEEAMRALRRLTPIAEVDVTAAVALRPVLAPEAP